MEYSKILYFTFTLQEFTENVKFPILWVLWDIIKKDINSYYTNHTTVY